MKATIQKMARVAAAVALVVISVAGCYPPEPEATPISQRKPGEDITPQMRAEKRGDPVAPDTPTPAPSAGGSTPSAPASGDTPGSSPITK